MKLQLFNFDKNGIRVMRDENGEFWFVAKDVCEALGIVWNGNTTLQNINEKWRMVLKLHTIKGDRKTVFINEAALYKLAFRSNKPEAEAFTDWVASDVLPTLRKTGTYSLTNQLLPAPSKWTKVFPDEFMRQVLKLYGYEYSKGSNPPQFVGHFINEYIYNTLDRKLSDTLKSARKKYAEDKGIIEVDEVAFLHQFLASEAKEALQSHLTMVIGIAASSPNIEVFKNAFQRAFTNRNQLELYLR